MSNKNTPFSQQLQVLNRGAFDDEIGEALADLVKAVRQTGKAGTLTITIGVNKLNARDENALKLTPKCKVKIPELAPYENIMFSTADGDLLRDDPNQRKIPDLETVPARAAATAQLA